MTQASKEIKVYGYRWAVLLVFGLVFMMSQLMWMAFSLIPNEAAPVLLGSPANLPAPAEMDLLVASQPLVFIIISIPVGMLADRKGLMIVAGTGSIVMTLFGALRIFLVNDFWMILICQLGLSVGAIMIQNCITYLSVNWFPKKERALATGVSTLFMLLGMLIGATMSLILWSGSLWTPPSGGSYSAAVAQANMVNILTIQAIAAVIFTVLFFAIARNKPKHAPDVDDLVTKRPSIMPMLKDRNVWIIAYGFFAGFAIIIGLLTILRKLLESLGFIAATGFGIPVIVEVLILLSGIFGAIIVSAISDKVGRRKPFFIFALFVGSAATLVLGLSPILLLTYVVAAILGFSLTSVMPVALSTLEELKTVGPRLSGASAGIAFELGNIGGLVGAIILDVLRDTATGSYFVSIVFLFVIALIAGGLVLLIPETGRRVKAKR